MFNEPRSNKLGNANMNSITHRNQSEHVAAALALIFGFTSLLPKVVDNTDVADLESATLGHTKSLQVGDVTVVHEFMERR